MAYSVAQPVRPQVRAEGVLHTHEIQLRLKCKTESTKFMHTHERSIPIEYV